MGGLVGMTQAKWDALSPKERDRLRSDTGLSPQLIGLEGWRVEVVDADGCTRRFIVGRSNGWQPCHIELKLRSSRGGHGAEREYRSMRKLYKVK